MEEKTITKEPKSRRVHIGPDSYERLEKIWTTLEERGAKNVNRAELVEEAISKLTEKHLEDYLERRTPLEYLFEKQKDDPEFRDRLFRLLKK